MAQPDPKPDFYVSIREACDRFGISRRTFYRMLGREPELADLVVRIPPETGRIRVPLLQFESWLSSDN